MLLKVQNLCLTLERMRVLYERCLELLDRERKSLIQLDFDTLFPIMREKDEVLSAIKAMDKQRLKSQDHFAMIMQKNASDLSLKNLAEILISEGGEGVEAGWKLLAHREALQNLIQTLTERVKRNNHFIEKSMHTLQGAAANLATALTGKANRAAAASKTYTGKGKVAAAVEAPGSIMEKRL